MAKRRRKVKSKVPEYLAQNFLHWHSSGDCWASLGRRVQKKSSWRPDEKTDQAMQLLMRFDYFQVIKTKKGVQVIVFESDSATASDLTENIPKAICDAIVKYTENVYGKVDS